MKRRAFLQNLTTGLAAYSTWLGQTAQSLDQLQQFQSRLRASQSENDLWKLVRSEFELDPQIIHLNCGSIGAVPKIVSGAQMDFIRTIEKDPFRNMFGDGLRNQLEPVRESAGRFLNASTAEIAITQNTTEGMNLIARGLSLNRGDEVLTSNHEHPGGMACWQFLAKRFGIKVVCVEIPNPLVDVDEIVSRIQDNITPRTKVFSFCHVDTITGTLMPIARLSQLAKRNDAFFVCDGAQAPGMLDVDVKKLAVDAYVSSSHKWLLAPKGSGLLYISSDSQQRIESLELSAGYNVYTASSGTRDLAQILAHGIAIEFQQSIGKQKIERRIRHLNQYLSEKLQRVTQLQRLTPDGELHSSGIATYSLDRTAGSSADLARRLRDESMVYVKPTQSTYALVPDSTDVRTNYNAIRFSTHFFNTETEIDRAVAAISRLLGN